MINYIIQELAFILHKCKVADSYAAIKRFAVLISPI